jgi:hypothetical protein
MLAAALTHRPGLALVCGRPRNGRLVSSSGCVAATRARAIRRGGPWIILNNEAIALLTDYERHSPSGCNDEELEVRNIFTLGFGAMGESLRI